MYLAASIEFLAVGMIGGVQLVQKATMEQNGVRALFLLGCGSIWLFLNQFFYRWLKGIHIDKKSAKYIFFISLAGLMRGSFIVGQMPNHFNGSLYIAWCFFLIIFMACVYVSYFMIKKKELQMRIQIMNTQNDMLERNYEQINEFYIANAKLYHDMNHHLDAVYRMLEKDDKEQAKQYIESLRKPMELSSIPLRTGIDMADVILCEMERKAAVRGISVHMDVQGLLQDITMEKKDLCALLTNLLDNAMEGAEKEIWVQIKPIHRMLIIQIKNDCIDIPAKENGRLKTTKKNLSLHGWGLQIIEQIVLKYEGSMEYHMEKGIFSVEIMVDVFYGSMIQNV